MKITRQHITRTAYLIIGSAIYAAGINLFLKPGDVAVGGFTGIAVMLNRILGLPIGAVVFAMNLPLLAVSWRVFGFRFVSSTLAAVAATSIFVDTMAFLPDAAGDPILSALFGGIALGGGCGMLFSKGFTTGGSDIIVSLLRLKFRGA